MKTVFASTNLKYRSIWDSPGDPVAKTLHPQHRGPQFYLRKMAPNLKQLLLEKITLMVDKSLSRVIKC